MLPRALLRAIEDDGVRWINFLDKYTEHSCNSSQPWFVIIVIKRSPSMLNVCHIYYLKTGSVTLVVNTITFLKKSEECHLIEETYVSFPLLCVPQFLSLRSKWYFTLNVDSL